jgi:ABC-2 type transport system permease protein
MGQAAGAWFKHPETPTLIFLAISLPQFFLTGFSWPREAIPRSVRVAGYILGQGGGGGARGVRAAAR